MINITLSPTFITDTVNLNTVFSDKISNYKTQVFLSAFDGYQIINTASLDYYVSLSLPPIILNSNQHSINLNTASGYYSYMNSLSYTYIMVDLTSFLYTPVTQYHDVTWLPTTIKINLDFAPFAENKCILGARRYQLNNNQKQSFILQTQNSTNFSQIFTITGVDLLSVMVCINYCKEGYGP